MRVCTEPEARQFDEAADQPAPLSAQDYGCVLHCPAFHVCAGDPNAGPKPNTAGALLTEPPPSPLAADA